MESTRRSRRHRNPKTQEPQQAEQQQPFFSRSAVGSTIQAKSESAFFQPKLTIGQPNDQYEQEADAVADKVVNQNTAANPAVQKQDNNIVQRLATPEEDKMPATNDERMAEDKKIQEKPVQKADKKEEEKPIQKAGKKEEEKPVQKADKKEEEKPVQKAPNKEKDATTKGKGVSIKEPFETRLAHSKDKGKPLPEKIRAKMEAEMQHDFSSVRVHDDAEAAELAEEIHAQAFAQGHDIYFNTEKFNPETTSGAHLLAHELTHVVQQGAAPTKAHKK